MLSACKALQGGGWALHIDKFIFIIILNDEASVRGSVRDQLQPSGYGHDLSPFCHVGRGDVDDVRVFVTVMNVKAIVRKDRAALNKRRIGEGDGFFAL